MWLHVNRSAAIELSPVELSLGELFAPDKLEDRHLSTEAKERQQLTQIIAMLEMLEEQVQEEERSRTTAQDAMETAIAEVSTLKAKIKAEKQVRMLVKAQAKQDSQVVLAVVQELIGAVEAVADQVDRLVQGVEEGVLPPLQQEPEPDILGTSGNARSESEAEGAEGNDKDDMTEDPDEAAENDDSEEDPDGQDGDASNLPEGGLDAAHLRQLRIELRSKQEQEQQLPNDQTAQSGSPDSELDRLQLKMEVGVSLKMIGQVLQAQGDVDAALLKYQDALDVLLQYLDSVSMHALSASPVTTTQIHAEQKQEEKTAEAGEEDSADATIAKATKAAQMGMIQVQAVARCMSAAVETPLLWSTKYANLNIAAQNELTKRAALASEVEQQKQAMSILNVAFNRLAGVVDQAEEEGLQFTRAVEAATPARINRLQNINAQRAVGALAGEGINQIARRAFQYAEKETQPGAANLPMLLAELRAELPLAGLWQGQYLMGQRGALHAHLTDRVNLNLTRPLPGGTRKQMAGVHEVQDVKLIEAIAASPRGWGDARQRAGQWQRSQVGKPAIWLAGTVRACRSLAAAYKVELDDPSGALIYIVDDVDTRIRPEILGSTTVKQTGQTKGAAGAERSHREEQMKTTSARAALGTEPDPIADKPVALTLRFGVGDRVMCFVGRKGAFTPESAAIRIQSRYRGRAGRHAASRQRWAKEAEVAATHGARVPRSAMDVQSLQRLISGLEDLAALCFHCGRPCHGQGDGCEWSAAKSERSIQCMSSASVETCSTAN
eukprot:COSAG02_NODE_3662_length_6405_cov_62.673327_3_plen_780_part_00